MIDCHGRVIETVGLFLKPGLREMNRIDATYGQLDKVLRSLGFTCRDPQDDPPARIYEHKETGASLMVPSLSLDERMLEYHFVTARVTLASPNLFDAQLRRAG